MTRRHRAPKRISLGCLLSSLLLLLIPHTAQALLLGPIEFLPTLELTGVYDDNIFLRAEGTPLLPVEEDFIGRIIPAVSFAYSRGRTNFLLGYRNEFLFHKNFPERDAKGDNHGVNFSVAHAFGPRSSVSLDDSFRIGTDISSIAAGGLEGQPQAGILPRGRDYRTNDLRLGGTHAITRRWDLMGEIAYQYRWYGSSLEGQPGDALQTETEDHLESIFLTGAYAWTPRHALTARLGFSHNDYDLRGRARYLTASVGYRGQIAKPLNIEGSAGLQYLNEDSRPDTGIPRQESVWPVADLSGTYALGDLSVLAAASVGLSDTSGFGGTAIRRQVRLSVDYRPWDPFGLRAFGLYTKSDSTSDDPRDALDLEAFQGGCEGTYRFNSWILARLQYTYIDQDSFGTIGGTYNDSRVLLSLILSLPETIR